jgi:hypothetical protein
MRSFHTSGLLALVAFPLVPALCSAEADFRNASWGMTPAQVMATEPGRPSEIRTRKGETVLEYRSAKMGSLEGRALYVFANNKLVRAKFLFDAPHNEANDFIGDFQAAEPLLKERYGKPSDDRALWEDDSTQDETKSYLEQDRATATGILPSDRFVGLAVALGHLKLYTRRNEGHTEIWHTLWGKDQQITHQIEYRSVGDGNVRSQRESDR